MTAAPLVGVRLVTIALNVPGPVAARRLRDLGADVTKVEPPGGDPLRGFAADWYAELCVGQQVIALDLKQPDDRERFSALLGPADVLLTSQRHGALARLGLDGESLRARHEHLLHVAIVGGRAEAANEPGHDLTYAATAGLVGAPSLPRSLWVDLAGAERAATAVLALLLGRQHGSAVRYSEVSLTDVANELAAPNRHGLTSEGGMLGGGLAFYAVYRARSGWVALAALEERFRQRLRDSLGRSDLTQETLAAVFAMRDAGDWEAWARARDLPVRALR